MFPSRNPRSIPKPNEYTRPEDYDITPKSSPEKLKPKIRKVGFRMIDNDLFGALMAARLSGASYQVVLAVIDRTLGFKKETADISLTYFQQVTGLSRQSVCMGIKQAKARGIIIVERNGTRKTSYTLNLDTWTWKGKKSTTSQLNHTSELIKAIIPDWSTKSHQTSQFAMPRTTRLKETLKERGNITNNLINTQGEVSPFEQTPSFLIKDKTNRERIAIWLASHSPASIKAIAKGTGIDHNMVNLTLHNGKGKVFKHLKDIRAWGLSNE